MRTVRTAAIATAVCLLAATPATAAPGGPDASFGKGGYVYTDQADLDLNTALVRTADGRVVVAGMAIGFGRDNRLVHSFHLIRYLGNGRVDTSFGSRGTARASFGEPAMPTDVVQRPDGRLVVAGSTARASGAIVLAGFTANGRPDGAFGKAGKVVVPVAGGSPTVAGAAVASDGAIVVAGSVSSQAGSTAFVQRFLSNGSPDTAFGPAGRVVVATTGQDAAALGVVAMPGGAVVVSGTTATQAVGRVPFLVRLLPNGLQDPTFGSAAMTNLGATWIGGIVRTANGSFVAAGGRPERGLDGGQDVGALVRFLPTGTLDPSFGNGGVLTVKAGSEAGLAGLTTLDDGRIVAVGVAARRTYDTLLVRLDALGRLDAAFGTNGVSIQGSPTAHDLAWDVVGSPGGAVTTAGIQSRGRGGLDGVTARFLG